MNQSGNWESSLVSGQTYRSTYTYGGAQPHAPSRIATTGPQPITIDYQYDASGNHTQRTSNFGTRNATWTDDDKLRSMKRVQDGYDLIRNYYDGSGQKAIAVHPGATSMEEVAFHRGDLTVRVNGDNQYVTKHIYAGGERLASKMDAAWFTSSPIQYYSNDHLGSAHYTLDGHQNLLSHTEFFPSGELWIDQLNQNYTQTPRWLFTGKEWDADTGLYDFGARQYDPRVGQWLSPDPILMSYMQGGPNGGVYNPANMALYGYVYNNPINYVDREGEFPILATAAAIAISVGFDAIGQIREGHMTWESWDLGRTGIAAGFGAAGVAGAGWALANVGGRITAATLGTFARNSAVAGGLASLGHRAVLDAHLGAGQNAQRLAQSGLIGAVGSALGAMVGVGASAAARHAGRAVPTKDGLLIALGGRRANTSSMGGPLGGRQSPTVVSAETGRRVAELVGGATGDAASGVYQDNMPGDAPASGSSSGVVSPRGGARGHDPKLLRMVPPEAKGR